jgi:predicted dehydrogenase
MATPITAIVVGAGHRALYYASYAQKHPEELKIVGVADPDERRRRLVLETYGCQPDMGFASAEELAARGRLAEVIINGTMDHQHVATTIPLLEAGYDVLLEKPIAIHVDELQQLHQVARRTGRLVMICHVLRYAPFYVAARSVIARGDLGEIMNLQTIEHVSYHHMAVGFVRGKWNREAGGSTMLMAKCCHDLDLQAWMMSGNAPTRVASFGGRQFFRPEKAPAGAGTRCVVDCAIEAQCQYSARKHYLEQGKWGFYCWAGIEHLKEATEQDKLEHLRTGPYGRCVWHCDNDVVDHQSVTVEFANGATATHNMVGGTARPSRAIHVVGTKGELQGVFEDNQLVLRFPDSRKGHEYREEKVNIGDFSDHHGAGGGHGGGDLRLVADFVHRVRGQAPSISCTTLEDSLAGHLIGFMADTARRDGRVVELPHW